MAKKVLPKHQTKGVVKANPYGKDFGAGLKNDVARKAYIKSDSFAKEATFRKPTDAEFKNPNVYKASIDKREANKKSAETFKKIGDEVRKTQGYPKREMEFKKGGAMKKMATGGITKSKKK